MRDVNKDKEGGREGRICYTDAPAYRKKYLDGVRDYRQVTSVSQQLSQPPAQKQFVSMNYVIVYN